MKPVRHVMLHLLAIVLGLACASTAMAETLTINSAINKAGRQRMLSQRMAKAYAQLGQNVLLDRAKKVLDDSVSLFDRQLVELKTFAPTPDIKDAYVRLERVWGQYKEVLIGRSPGKEGARTVVALSEETLRIADEGTQKLEKHSGKASGHLINLSGRQRMLSQRIAKFWLMRQWGVEYADAQKLQEASLRLFRDSHRELVGAAQNTAKIGEELQIADVQWGFLDMALKQAGGDKARQLENVAKASENFLTQMELVTELYQQLPQ